MKNFPEISVGQRHPDVEKFSATGLAQELRRSRRSSRAARNLPPLASRRVWRKAFSPFLFLFSGGPGLAGWILYRSASLVVDACCNKIPPSVRPLDFVAIYRLVHKWLLSLFVPNLTSVPSLFTPVFGITGRSVGRPQPRGVDRVPAYPPAPPHLAA